MYGPHGEPCMTDGDDRGQDYPIPPMPSELKMAARMGPGSPPGARPAKNARKR